MRFKSVAAEWFVGSTSFHAIGLGEGYRFVNVAHRDHFQLLAEVGLGEGSGDMYRTRFAGEDVEIVIGEEVVDAVEREEHGACEHV